MDLVRPILDTWECRQRKRLSLIIKYRKGEQKGQLSIMCVWNPLLLERVLDPTFAKNS